MPFDRVDIGNIQLLALLDHDGDADTLAEAFPGFPPEALEAYRERYPGVYGADGRWRLRVRGWLIRHPGGLILVDTGIGGPGSTGPEWAGSAGRLLEVLHETGTPPEAIGTVVISHVHDDHVGGTSVFTPQGPEGDLVPSPAYPNARYLVQRADWDWLRESAEEDEWNAAILARLLMPIQDAGLLDVIEGDRTLVDGIEVHLAPGHTPGHQVVRLRSDNERAIVTADAFNHPAQLSHPDWPSGSDSSPVQAAATRRALLAGALSHPTTLAPTHFAESFGRIETGPDGLAAWVATSS